MRGEMPSTVDSYALQLKQPKKKFCRVLEIVPIACECQLFEFWVPMSLPTFTNPHE